MNLRTSLLEIEETLHFVPEHSPRERSGMTCTPS